MPPGRHLAGHLTTEEQRCEALAVEGNHDLPILDVLGMLRVTVIVACRHSSRTTPLTSRREPRRSGR